MLSHSPLPRPPKDLPTLKTLLEERGPLKHPFEERRTLKHPFEERRPATQAAMMSALLPIDCCAREANSGLLDCVPRATREELARPPSLSLSLSLSLARSEVPSFGGRRFQGSWLAGPS